MPDNLLIITPDQLRADYLSCYGHPSIGTKHTDRLASQSVQLDNCYCAAPLCGPSRISFATSTYVGEHGHRDYGSTISPSVPNLISCLIQAGYRTGMFGKNHLFTPSKLRQLWDELDELCLGNRDKHPAYINAHSAFTLGLDHPYNNTAKLTNETIDFISHSADGGRPFAAWVNYQDPHPAFCAPPPYDSLFDPSSVALPAGWNIPANEPTRNASWRALSRAAECSEQDIRKAIAMYMGQVRLIDDAVGQLMSAIDRADIGQRTLVLFFSDHGELLGHRRMTHKIPVFYDCLTKIPALLRLPSRHWAGRRVESLVEEVDLTPTLLELLGLPAPPTMIGRSLLPHLRGDRPVHRESILCEAGVGAPTPRLPLPEGNWKAPHAPASFGPGAMVRQGEWKLSVYADDAIELFNVIADPAELQNRAADARCQTILQELLLLLSRRLLGVKVRDIGLKWPSNGYPRDVRLAPLE